MLNPSAIKLFLNLTPGGSGPGWSTDSVGYLLYNSTVHRKIAMYRAIANIYDEEGHGTHTAGSIAGSLESGALVRLTYQFNVCKGMKLMQSAIYCA